VDVACSIASDFGGSASVQPEAVSQTAAMPEMMMRFVFMGPPDP
jgi:hypothetical protein